MSRTLCFGVVFLAAAFYRTSAQQQALPSSPREQLQQYVAQLQANPSDDALRTKIIQLAQTLEPKPAVPEDAQAADGKAKTIFAHATSPDDLKAAAAAFAQASLLAPWVSDYYFNEAAAAEKAAQYDEAIHALSFYLVAAPDSSDAGAVRGRIEGIKYAKAQPSSDSKAAHAALDALWKSNDPVQIQFLGEGGGRIGFALSTQQYPWRYDYWWQNTTVIETRCPGFRNRLVVGRVYSVRPNLNGGAGSIDGEGRECSLMNFAPYVEMECDRQQPYPHIGANGSVDCSASTMQHLVSAGSGPTSQETAAESLAGHWDCQSGCDSAQLNITGNVVSGTIIAEVTVATACAYDDSGRCGQTLVLTLAGSTDGHEITGALKLPRMHDTRTNCELPAQSERFGGTVSDDGKSITLNFQIPNWNTNAERTLIGIRCANISQAGSYSKFIGLTR